MKKRTIFIIIFLLVVITSIMIIAKLENNINEKKNLPIIELENTENKVPRENDYIDKEQVEATPENSVQNDTLSINNQELPVFKQSETTLFLQRVTLHNVELKALPSKDSKTLNVINGNVLIYNVIQEVNDYNNKWILLEYLESEADGGNLINHIGYIDFKDFKGEVESYDINEIPFGYNNIYIGDDFKKVLYHESRFHLNKRFGYTWVITNANGSIKFVIDPTYLYIRELEFIAEHDSDIVIINDKLTSKSTWDDILNYFKESDIEYEVNFTEKKVKANFDDEKFVEIIYYDDATQVVVRDPLPGDIEPE